MIRKAWIKMRELRAVAKAKRKLGLHPHKTLPESYWVDVGRKDGKKELKMKANILTLTEGPAYGQGWS